jgi:hypothetical protein
LRVTKPQDVFIITDEHGTPLEGTKSEKNLPYKVYYAKKPSLAATKAYYALVRSQKPSKEPMPLTGLSEIEAHVASISTPEQTRVYMSKVKQAAVEPSAFVYLRRPEENKIRSYFVGYERVLKPNKHEVDKGIVKVAVAHVR